MPTKTKATPKPKTDPNAARKEQFLGPSQKFPHGLRLTNLADGHVSFERYISAKERDARVLALRSPHVTVAPIDWKRRGLL